MFRMPSLNTPRCYFLLPFVIGLIVAQAVVPKCITLEITLDGKIAGALTEDQKVSVEVVSATEGDSVTDVRQKSSVTDANFKVVAWFNTTSNVVREETCDRRPRLVIVKLTDGKGEADRQTLAIDKDFRRTKYGYKATTPLILHARTQQ